MTPVLLIFVLRFVGAIIGGCLAMTTDIRHQRIPNRLCVAMLVAGLIFRTATGGLDGFLDAMGGGAAGFGILMVLHVIGGGGAGDVKFMTAVGTWIGPYHMLFVFVLSAMLLAFFSLAWFIWKLTHGKWNRTEGSQGNPLRTRIPYAVPATLAMVLRLAWLLLIGRDG